MMKANQKNIGAALKGHPVVRFGAIEAIKIMMVINTGFKKCIHESTSIIINNQKRQK